MWNGRILRNTARVNDGVAPPIVCTYRILRPVARRIGLLYDPVAIIRWNWYRVTQFVPPSIDSSIVTSIVGFVPVTAVTGIVTWKLLPSEFDIEDVVLLVVIAALVISVRTRIPGLMNTPPDQSDDDIDAAFVIPNAPPEAYIGNALDRSFVPCRNILVKFGVY